jgi:methionyl-tRNA synthetase
MAKAMKGNDPASAAILKFGINRTVYHCAEATRIVGILLQPYMPGKSAELLDMLGVDKSRRTFDDARLGADFDYGVPKVPLGRDSWDALFPPLPVDT